jgi:glycosyltransferase involved in cell wall biosynthesis
LVVVGDGPSRSHLQSLAKQLLPTGGGERGPGSPSATCAWQVHFLGYRKDVPDLLRQIDCVLLPSKREGMPNAVLEANASGVPVLASDIPAHRNLLQPGANGWLVTADGGGRDVQGPLSGDTSETVAVWARAMRRILLDPEQCREMARLARKRAADSFAMSGMVDSYASLYRNLMVK